MPARINKVTHDTKTKRLIQASQLLNRLTAFANSEIELTSAQVNAAKVVQKLKLEVIAGHGLDYHNVRAIVEITEVIEVNIGHSIISRAVLVGMERAVREMKMAMGGLL